MTTDRIQRSHRLPQALLAAVAASATVVMFSLPAAAQTDNNQRPYLPSVPATNPNPSDTRPTPQNSAPGQTQPIVTAAVAGIQVTTAPPTTVAATVVSVAPSPASVLGITIEEQAEDVAFTGSESGRFTGIGVALTAVGALLIGVTRSRRRRAQH